MMLLVNGKNVNVKHIDFYDDVCIIDTIEEDGEDGRVCLYNDDALLMYLDGVQVKSDSYEEDRDRYDLGLLEDMNGGDFEG